MAKSQDSLRPITLLPRYLLGFVLRILECESCAPEDEWLESLRVISTRAWGSRELVNKSKSPSWENSTGANSNWQDTRWRTCCGTRTVPRLQQCFPKLDRRISHWVGLVGIHHIVEDCRVQWKTKRKLQLIPARLPRDHMPILILRYTLRLLAEGRQASGICASSGQFL